MIFVRKHTAWIDTHTYSHVHTCCSEEAQLSLTSAWKIITQVHEGRITKYEGQL